MRTCVVARGRETWARHRRGWGTRTALWTIGLLLLVGASAGAHDLGVARVELRELEAGHYRLTAEVPPELAPDLPPPRLPARCERLDDPSRPSFAGGLVRFEFKCRGAPLNADDVLTLPWPREGAMVVARWRDGTTGMYFFPRTETGIRIELRFLKAAARSIWETARRYTVLGIEHILLGVDHLLFVLGLLFLVRGGWRVAQTITAFTLSHSLSLALATFGVVNAPARAVDAVVALSIVFLGVEIMHARQGRPGLTVRYPWVVAFAFGLVHGLGFASALHALGLPEREIPPALLFFNVGVEIGQLIFVLAFLSLRWALRRLEVRFPRWTEPLPAYGIGVVASYWLIGRVGLLLSGVGG